MTTKTVIVKYNESDTDRIATAIGYDTYAQGLLELDPPVEPLSKEEYIKNRIPGGIRAECNNYDSQMGYDQEPGYQWVNFTVVLGDDE